MRELTDVERCFVDHFYHETLQFEVGPAQKWIIDHGMLPDDLQPFLLARTEEMGLNAPERPTEFMPPWKDEAEFLMRRKAMGGN
jgi:hypothetical protein